MMNRIVRRVLEHTAESKPDSRTGRGKRFVAYMFTDGLMPYLWTALFVTCLAWWVLSLVPTTYYMTVEQEEVAEEVFPDRLSCQANTIVAQSLSTCYAHPNCNLGDEEMITMYMARKAALIDCRRADMIEAYILERLMKKVVPII